MTTSAFPFLFGRAFVEAFATGLGHGSRRGFPFLFGRAFIEAFMVKVGGRPGIRFPFLFGRAFIEVGRTKSLSLRVMCISPLSSGDLH